ncbi:MAG: AmmeMemoRadiSam system protein B [Patescibacteria group bacterium]
MNDSFWVFVVTIILIFVILVGGFWFSSHNNDSEQEEASKMNQEISNLDPIRPAAQAGQFYPAEAKELMSQVSEFLAGAERVKTDGRVLGLIVPHAGYIYSGQIAGWGFKQIEGEDIETVILIGNSHSAYFSGAAIYDKGSFATPLGEVAIDAELAAEIIKENNIIKADTAAHATEHSLEVEIPFLQQTLKNFKIVPILMGNGNLEDVEILAQAISKNITGQKVLIVASSDMSHYPPYEKANYADKKTYEAILTGDAAKLEKTIAQLTAENIVGAQTFLCGQHAVEVLMRVMASAGAKDIKLLKYANSGDVPVGDKSKVVGYGAIGFYGKKRAGELNLVEQERLIDIARQTIEAYATLGRAPVLQEDSVALNQKLGVFVTLKKNGQLRGCIGVFTGGSDLPLWQMVREMAKAAAFNDPRFSPVNAGELKDLEYEVSVLSPLKKINDWQQIELGKHGVEIKRGTSSGVFLPQVATETGWDLETFMGQLCSQKAGLPWDCWKEKETEIYTFTAQVF